MIEQSPFFKYISEHPDTLKYLTLIQIRELKNDALKIINETILTKEDKNELWASQIWSIIPVCAQKIRNIFLFEDSEESDKNNAGIVLSWIYAIFCLGNSTTQKYRKMIAQMEIKIGIYLLITQQKDEAKTHYSSIVKPLVEELFNENSPHFIDMDWSQVTFLSKSEWDKYKALVE